MAVANQTKPVDYSFKILEEILMLKKYKTKEEVIQVAEIMQRIALSKENYSQNVKESYKEACKKLKSLSFEEMNEIIGILSSYD